MMPVDESAPPPDPDVETEQLSAQEADKSTTPLDDVPVDATVSVPRGGDSDPAHENTAGSEDSTEPDTRRLRMLPKLGTDVQPWRVIFQIIVPDTKVIGVDVHDVAVVGRSDPNANIIPDLDLEPYGAQIYGVSRRHAILLPTDEGLCLIDLDSTNGTWINGVYLQPGQKYRLRSGDRVEFGRLRLVVRVVGAMLTGVPESQDDITAVTRPKPRRR